MKTKIKQGHVVRLSKDMAESMAAEPLKAKDMFLRLAEWRNRSLDTKIRIN